MAEDLNDVLRREGRDAIRAKFDRAAHKINGNGANGTYTREQRANSANSTNGANAHFEHRFEEANRAKPKAKAFDPRFKFLHIDDVEPVLDELYLIQGLMPASGLMIVYGAPSCGKSFLVTNAALHVAAGLEYAGRRVEKAHVIYIVAEGGRPFRNRIHEAKKRLGIKRGDASFNIIEVVPNLGTASGDAEALIVAVKEQLPDDGLPILVVVDTVSRTLAGAKENSDEGMGVFVSNCGKLSDELGRGLVIGIHHKGKSEAAGMRGWSGLHGACDAEWEVDENDTGKSVQLVKLKDGQDKLTWTFALESVEVGENRYGDPVTTCVVNLTSEPGVTAAKPKVERPKKPNAAHDFFHAAFNDVSIASSVKRCVRGDGPQVNAVQLDLVRAEFFRRWPTGEPDTRKGNAVKRTAFNRALKELVNGNPYHTEADGEGGVEWIW